MREIISFFFSIEKTRMSWILKFTRRINHKCKCNVIPAKYYIKLYDVTKYDV